MIDKGRAGDDRPAPPSMTIQERQIIRGAIKNIMGADFSRGVDALCHLIGRCYPVAHMRPIPAEDVRRLLAGKPRCKRKRMPR